MKQILLTKREIDEIKLCMFYTENLRHRTDGHNRMILVASLAYSIGFLMDGQALTIPDNVSVLDEMADKDSKIE
jgi:hypothetical protein